MLEVRKDTGVLVYEGNFFAHTASFSAGRPYAEFVDGSWVKPVDPVDPWEAKVISWEEFAKRTSTQVSY